MALGKFGPASAWLTVDGYDLTAAKVKSIKFIETSPQEETTGIGDSSVERTPIGVTDTGLEFEGAVWSTTVLEGHAALIDDAAGNPQLPTTPQTAVRILCMGMAGHTKGYPFFGAEGIYHSDVEVLATNGELNKVNATNVVTGQGDEGVILHELTAITADVNTESAGSVDRADATSLVAITSSSIANPSVITTPVAHGIVTGSLVLIASHSGETPEIEGEHVATVTSSTTFTIPVNVTTGGTGGTVQQVNTLSGGFGYQQVTAETGFSVYVGKVVDSADDSTFADLVTFVDAPTAPDGQRVAATGTVDRYLAADLDVTGSGSLTVFIGFARS